MEKKITSTRNDLVIRECSSTFGIQLLEDLVFGGLLSRLTGICF